MVDKFEYGAIVIDGKTYKSDVIILPDGSVIPWQHKDEHVLRSTDLKRVIEAKPEVLVIGLGTIGNVSLQSDAGEVIQEAGIELMAYKTDKACETYNAVRGQRKVVAIFHVDC